MTNTSGPWGQPPRSTPIPGSGDPISAPSGFEQTPPTPSQFLGGVGPQPAAPPPGAPQPGAMPGQFGGAPFPQINYPVTARKRSVGGTIIVMVIVLATVGGIGVGVWAAVKGVQTANEASDRADELSDPALSEGDRAALGLTGAEQFLWQGEGMARMAAAFENGIAGEPTNFVQMSFYGDYAFATAQHPTAMNQLDQYGWRTAALGAPTPQQNDDEAALKVFTIDQIDWAAVAMTAAQAPAILGITDGEISHVIVDKPYFIDAEPLSVKVYVTSPRDSGYVQIAPDGTVMASY